MFLFVFLLFFSAGFYTYLHFATMLRYVTAFISFSRNDVCVCVFYSFILCAQSGIRFQNLFLTYGSQRMKGEGSSQHYVIEKYGMAPTVRRGARPAGRLLMNIPALARDARAQAGQRGRGKCLRVL